MTFTQRDAVAVGGLAAGAAVLASPSCGGDGGTSPPGTNTTTTSTSASSSASSASSTSSTSSSSSGNPACPPLPNPPGVPAGWVEFTDWSCNCRFYVPGSKEVLPKPIEWEPCKAIPAGAPPGLVCKVMVTDWTAETEPVSFEPAFDRNSDGSAVLGFKRVRFATPNPFHLDLVADADGLVRSAILKVLDPSELAGVSAGCSLLGESINDRKHVVDVRGNDSSAGTWSQDQGVLGWSSIDQLKPAVLAHYVDNLDYSWWCNAKWVARQSDPGNRLMMMPWSMKPQTEVTSLATDPENLQISDIVLSGDAAFWDANDSLQAAIGSWDPAHGTRQLVRFLGDHTKGAGGLGTDGKDMVWSYGEGKQPGDDISTYPTRSIMTAPFTTDPAALKPRRLRSQPGETIGVTTWVLGCGYAAHVSGLGAIVVRIADGVSWVLPSNYPDFTPKTPIGLTCDDVFVMGTLNGKIDIGRFRLDSLGPGTPPD